MQDVASRLQVHAASPDVVLVVADERSVSTIGRWPWRRALHAQLVRHISAGGPQSIGLGILFTEPDLDYPQDDLLLAQANRAFNALPVLLALGALTVLAAWIAAAWWQLAFSPAAVLLVILLPTATPPRWGAICSNTSQWPICWKVAMERGTLQPL